MTNQKNLILATGLSIAILLAYNFLVERPKLEAMRAAAVAAQLAAPQQPAALPQIPAAEVAKPRGAVVAGGQRIAIETPGVKGTLNLKGARFDDLQLVKYFTGLDHQENVTLLSPVGTVEPYYIEQGWLADNVKTPNGESLWQADGKTLTPTAPITLRWNNGEGLTFIKTITVDEHYLFRITQRVENQSGKTITLYPYGRITRLHHAESNSEKTAAHHDPLMSLHGLLGVFGAEFHSATYDDLTKSRETPQESVTRTAAGGWMGMTDKYWFTALVPDQQTPVDARFVRSGSAPLVGTWPFRHVEKDQRDFQVDYRGQAITLADGEKGEHSAHFFAGAKEMAVLDAYEQKPGIPKFDLAVDFGWFYAITKPFFYLLTWIGQTVGNFGLAIILFTLIVRGAMFPVAAQSYRSMQKMKIAGPKLKELQAKYKDDPVKLQGEMMAFYRKEKLNPMAGCLPMLIQIPVFFSLYKVLYVTLEMRQAPFFGFLTDLSVKDPSNVFNLFGLLPFVPPEALHLGILPILMGVTSWLQMRMTPTPTTDETQKQMFAMMPWMMMVMLSGLPAGLLLYWIASNTLGILQQWWIQKSIATD